MCERNIDWLPLAHLQWGTKPSTQACALAGNGTGDPSLCRTTLNQLSHTSRGSVPCFYGRAAGCRVRDGRSSASSPSASRRPSLQHSHPPDP